MREVSDLRQRRAGGLAEAERAKPWDSQEYHTCSMLLVEVGCLILARKLSQESGAIYLT